MTTSFLSLRPQLQEVKRLKFYSLPANHRDYHFQAGVDVVVLVTQGSTSTWKEPGRKTSKPTNRPHPKCPAPAGVGLNLACQLWCRKKTGHCWETLPLANQMEDDTGRPGAYWPPIPSWRSGQGEKGNQGSPQLSKCHSAQTSRYSQWTCSTCQKRLVPTPHS